jgi:Zn-dependent M32 family carboxypeptidase
MITIHPISAAQFFNTFAHVYPDWKEKTVSGDLDFIRERLRAHIHKYGRQYTSAELCTEVTGKIISEKPFIDYLNQVQRAISNYLRDVSILAIQLQIFFL